MTDSTEDQPAELDFTVSALGDSERVYFKERAMGVDPPAVADPQTMPSAKQPPYAAYVAIVGVLAVAGVGIVAMIHYGKASDAVTVLGPVTGVISAIVAAFFGIRSASLAQQKSNETAAVKAQGTTRGPTP